MRAKTADYRYERIAEKLSRLIEEGAFRPGDRIPSVRRLSQSERASISTVLQAFFLLESRGLIEARPQSGFYVRPQLRRLPPEPKIKIPPEAASRLSIAPLGLKILHAALDPKMVPLGAAMPSPDLFPTAKLHRLLASIARRLGDESNAYQFSTGRIELRRQIALRSLDWGGGLSPEDIVITNGCTEAINLCLRAIARPGDVIAVESPTFFIFLLALESLGLKALEVPTYPREGVCLNELRGLLDRNKVKACLFMTNFSNPLGSCMPVEKKKSLVELLSEREIPLIEDDIYGEHYFGKTRPKTCKSFDREGWVLLCSSFTKTLTPSHRVGWAAPGRFRSQVEQLKMIGSAGNALLPQLMIAEFIKNGGYDHHLRGLRRSFGQQVQILAQAVGRYFPEGTKVSRPSGGMVLWVELPAQVDAFELYRRAAQKNISIAPGPIFSASQSFRNCIRINCAMRWSERLEQALITVGRLAAELSIVPQRKKSSLKRAVSQ